MNVDYKQQFPLLTKHPHLVYLDNAATTQKPASVINALTTFYTESNANIHRGLYPLAEQATEQYEQAKNTIATFLGVDNHAIITVPSATAALNGLAAQLKNQFENKKKTYHVLVTEADHHANIVPWQQHPEYTLTFAPMHKKNVTTDFESVADQQFDIISIPHASNTTGNIIKVPAVRSLFPDAIIILDISQTIAHFPVHEILQHVDFATFSAHKAYGPFGVGFLYGKTSRLEHLPPFQFGGGMINQVTKKMSTWAPIPERFEAGTPSIADTIAAAAGITYIQEISLNTIQKHEQELRAYAYEKITTIKHVRIFHPPLAMQTVGVISFTHEKIHAHDIAAFLGEKHICVRAGHHCAQILHTTLAVPASVRISFGIYNTKEDINQAVDAIKEAIAYFS